MTKQEAEEILKDSITEHGLYNLTHYLSWDNGDDSICLDDHFSLEELEAIVWWMKNKNSDIIRKCYFCSYEICNHCQMCGESLICRCKKKGSNYV